MTSGNFLTWALCIAAIAGIFIVFGLSKSKSEAAVTLAASDPSIQKITKSETEWKQTLTPEQYEIMREEGTEPPFTSPLNHEHRKGVFVCAACGLELFHSSDKYDSGTGWPSFFDVIPGRIETKTDNALFTPRTEYHCARCGGHLGHVFDDGPKPTGLRYCTNGAAISFIPEKKE